jgi:hypothetical protein
MGDGRHGGGHIWKTQPATLSFNSPCTLSFNPFLVLGSNRLSNLPVSTASTQQS